MKKTLKIILLLLTLPTWLLIGFFIGVIGGIDMGMEILDI